MEYIGIITTIVGGVTTIIGSILVLKSKTLTSVVAEQKELITTLQTAKGEQKDQISKLQDQNIKHTGEISELRGQITVLRDVPLKSIAADLSNLQNNTSKTSKLVEK